MITGVPLSSSVCHSRKKASALISINEPLASALSTSDVEAVIQHVDEAEVDEMWSFVSKKKEQRWLWHAIDHGNDGVLAFVFGRRTDAAFLQLKTLLEPFGITRYHTN